MATRSVSIAIDGDGYVIFEFQVGSLKGLPFRRWTQCQY